MCALHCVSYWSTEHERDYYIFSWLVDNNFYDSMKLKSKTRTTKLTSLVWMTSMVTQGNSIDNICLIISTTVLFNYLIFHYYKDTKWFDTLSEWDASNEHGKMIVLT